MSTLIDLGVYVGFTLLGGSLAIIPIYILKLILIDNEKITLDS